MAKPYLISYDLDKPGQNYPRLIARLQAHGAVRVLLSQWALTSTWSAEQLRNDLQAYMDTNDRILVVEISGQWAYSNIMASENFKQIAA
ncbi:MAG TPA: hypothetical protein VGQ49_19665 [Bryobacteraceae bacterium]|jgi:hypothetical protein|nr:hypothetical protein [Bryobacteraceae bacterium]